MNGVSAAARVAAAINRYGEAMVLKTRAATAAPLTSTTVQGTMRDFAPGELVGELRAGDAEVILTTTGAAPKQGGILAVQGRDWVIRGVETIRLSGTAVAHRLWVRGG